jgi:hypothetical protein
MGGRPNRGAGYLIALLLICGLAGGAVGEAIGQNVKGVAFFKNYMTVGMTKPVILDLKLISLTFGIAFSINFLSLIGMIVGYFIYKKM